MLTFHQRSVEHSKVADPFILKLAESNLFSNFTGEISVEVYNPTHGFETQSLRGSVLNVTGI